MVVWIILVEVSINTRDWIMLCHYQEVGSDNCIQFCQQECYVMRVIIYFIWSFSSVCVTGTFAQLIVECITCMVNIIAVRLCAGADTSVNLLFLCISCLDCFDTVKCHMQVVYLQPFMHTPANKVRGKIIQKVVLIKIYDINIKLILSMHPIQQSV
jgi:hypothetical protein